MYDVGKLVVLLKVEIVLLGNEVTYHLRARMGTYLIDEESRYTKEGHHMRGMTQNIKKEERMKSECRSVYSYEHCKGKTCALS